MKRIFLFILIMLPMLSFAQYSGDKFQVDVGWGANKYNPDSTGIKKAFARAYSIFQTTGVIPLITFAPGSYNIGSCTLHPQGTLALWGEQASITGTNANGIINDNNQIVHISIFGSISFTDASGDSIQMQNGSSSVYDKRYDKITAGSVNWGDITGTLSTQADLNTVLNGKASTSRLNAISEDSLISSVYAVDSHTLAFRDKGGTSLYTINLDVSHFSLSGPSNPTLTYTPTNTLEGNTDWNSNGFILSSQTYDASVSAGNLCYFDGTKWYQADASLPSTSSKMFGIALGSNKILTMGIWTGAGLTAGAIYYASENSGDITTTAPSNTGTVVRIIGYALSTTKLYFNPSNDYVEN